MKSFEPDEQEVVELDVETLAAIQEGENVLARGEFVTLKESNARFETLLEERRKVRASFEIVK